MGSKWDSTTIGDLIDEYGGEIKTGPFGTKLKASEYTEQGVPVISVGEVQFGNLVIHDRTPKVDSTVTKRMPEYLLEEGDIVIGRKGAVERSARVQKSQDGWFLGSDGIRLRLPKSCNSLFVSYQFLTEAHKYWMIQHAAGTTMPSLNERIIRRIPIIVPPLCTQSTIAHILGTLDDKIELNRQMNATLEAMAQALFKSWFVDFDPVIDKAIAAGNPIPEPLRKRAEARKVLGDQRKPLPEHIEAHFPDRFVFNDEMGWVPEGWEVGLIGNLCEKIQNGGTPRRDKSEYWDNGTIPWLTSGEVRQTIIYKVNNKITDLGLQNSSAKWLPESTTVVAMYGATAGQVSFISKPLTTNQAVCGLVPRQHYRFFNYLALARTVKELANQARGSAQQNINKRIIEGTQTIIPPDLIGNLFSDRVGICFDRWIQNLKSLENIEKLRDTLLPKLLSGELRIPDAENLIKDTI